MLTAAMAYLSAIWVMAGIAMALYGLMPRFTFVNCGALLGIINRCYCDPLRSVHGCDE
jgi:putative exporter of polyketide antibiotics